MRIIIVLALCFIPMWGAAQSPYHIAGLILDENNLPVPGCHVKTEHSFTVSDGEGRFIFNNITEQSVNLSISFIGYQTFDTTLLAARHHHLRINLAPDEISLDEVSIRGNQLKTTPGLSRETIHSDQLSQQMNGTLVRTLDRQVGFNAMDIGASASKPVIRGMGFNRIAVVDNGIKQEGQQWGADHGLEIDPFLTEQAEIIRGAASLEHGSDAIGGILELTSNRPPDPGFAGSVQLLGKSINETAGGSLMLQGSNSTYFFKSRITVLDFGDYRIPTDTIVYLSRQVPIHNRRLKNSAGKEHDIYLQAGVMGSFWRSSISASRVWQESGFFPGSHGLPDNRRVEDDGNTRNIDHPKQSVEHRKITSNTLIHTPHSVISFDLGFQENHRQERSLFHTHFGNQEPPLLDPDLELDFNLKTWSANGRWNFRLTPQHSFTFGSQWQWQNNVSEGYGFLLPEFSRQSKGIFLKHEFTLNKKWQINSGVRYDHIVLETQPFYDPVLYEFMVNNGMDQETATSYARRASQINRSFGDYSWLAGLRYTPSKQLNITLNLGESFRAPTAGELSINGIHHGSFRHEKGNKNLSSERSFFTDVHAEFIQSKRSFRVSPYLYRFSNYIFLNPTGEWSLLPHSGQIYIFSESATVMAGVEIGYKEQLGQRWEVDFNSEWLYNYQTGTYTYPLPFSPPASAFGEISYLLQPERNQRSIRLSLHAKAAADQKRIARNEERTEGYVIFGAALFMPVRSAEINLQAHNLLNTKYYNHISFYRKLEIPEPGRNIQILVKIPF
jgi:iron complex outermembrane recepter protein